MIEKGQEKNLSESDEEKVTVGKKVLDYAYSKTPKRFKNASDLQVRFRTGIVYVLLTMLGLLLGNITSMFMLSLTAGLAAGEFFYMQRGEKRYLNEFLGIVGAVSFPPVVYCAGLAGAMILTLALVVALTIWYLFQSEARIHDMSIGLSGAAYTGLLLSAVMLLRPMLPEPWGGVLWLIIFGSVWINDISAYLVGRKFGKHKIAPKISPKKTWEGFTAGIIGSMGTWCLILLIPGVDISVWQCLLFGLICGVAGVLGDFTESKIKRNSGVKDSGTLMPGHGGILDRTDSLFLVVVFATLLLEAGGCLPPIL